MHILWLNGKDVRMSSRLSAFLIAAFVLIADQLSKLCVVHYWQMQEGDRFAVMPFFDIVFVWNRGISYGLFQQETPLGRWILFGLTLAAVVILCIWIMREPSALMRNGLGLIVGGAVGNGIDRAAYGAVVDFVSLYFGHFAWYIFNVADAAIVAGVAILLYGSFFTKEKPATTPHEAK